MSRVASGNSRSARAAHGAPRRGAGLRSSRQQVAGGAAQCQQPKANPPEGLEPGDAQAGNNPDRGGKQGDVQVGISLELIVASLAAGPPATVPTPPMTAAAMLILKSQDRVFVFVPMVVAVCFRCVNFASGPYPDHAARSSVLLQIGFEIELCSFI
ncbi:hypothetical protein DBIPINDM_003260 [Mesorhizobium sp. AR02]|uniref:hypothetical protein n=1 Tax=Mesorhizobium sp. AR02 TaxID=2865837 RepID=UPI00215EEBD0|nr:hypothetical protein [Mesorhizobium sp. AR02]UVK56641.1 hypothetical protein DBIPINDM_003260 [Mesorhizobium sp. AR02]